MRDDRMVMTPTLPELQLKHIVYTYDASSDIHVARFLGKQREAAEEFFDIILPAVYADKGNHDEIRLLIDYRESGFPSVNYSFRKGIAWARSLSVHPDVKIVILSENNFMLSTLDTLLQTLQFRHLQTRFFGLDEAGAQAWLQGPF